MIEHPDGAILVDTGELAATPDPPIARFSIDREQEIDRQLAALGMRRILEHARRHATVFLPSHDPASAAHLAERRILEAT